MPDPYVETLPGKGLLIKVGDFAKGSLARGVSVVAKLHTRYLAANITLTLSRGAVTIQSYMHEDKRPESTTFPVKLEDIRASPSTRREVSSIPQGRTPSPGLCINVVDGEDPALSSWAWHVCSPTSSEVALSSHILIHWEEHSP